jgi:hypothetical protein
MRWLLAVSVLAGQSFDRDLQPVFRQHCYACHAANVKMGSLDVETMDGLLRGGNRGTIIVPGKATESRLYLTLTGALEPVMPMGDDKLTAAELTVVKNWIDNGARPDPGGLLWRGATIAAGYGAEIRLFNTTGQLLRKIAAQVGTVRAVALSADGTYVAAKGPEIQRIFEAATGREVPAREFDFHSSRTALSPNGQRRATMRDDGSVTFEDVR